MVNGEQEQKLHRVGGRRGILLLEMVFAVALLAVALSGACLMVVQSMYMMLAARDRYVATTLCLARIERARDIDYALLNLLADQPPGVRVDGEGVPDPAGAFRRETTVQTDVPASGLTSVSVTVSFLDRRSRTFGAGREVISCVFTQYLVAPTS